MAATAAQQYVCASLGSFLVGLAGGYTMDYSFNCSADPVDQACASAGAAIGTLLNAGPKAVMKIGATAVKVVGNMVQKGAVETISTVAQKSIAKTFSWWKPVAHAVLKATEKTAAAAEKVFIQESKNLTFSNTFVLNNNPCNSVNAIRLKNSLIAREIVGGHAFGKHALKFGFTNKEQMALHINKVLTNPTMTRNLSNGRSAFWHEISGSIVIRNPKAIDGGTSFIPENGINYFFKEIH